jgi:hypothetical protein
MIEAVGITWLVRQHASDIKLGERVFIWRAQGKSASVAGVIAECVVASPVRVMEEEPEAVAFWKGHFVPRSQRRVWLRVTNVADEGHCLTRTSLLRDPILKDAQPIVRPRGTNFELTAEASGRLSELWNRWGHAEERPEFLDQTSRAFEEDVRALQQDSLAELMEIYKRELLLAPIKPKTRSVVAEAFDRNPRVVAIARLRAKFRCEVPDCKSETFLTSEKLPYCEVHHLTPLARGGMDRIENVACLCANHHRELHIGPRSQELTAVLAQLRSSET